MKTHHSIQSIILAVLLQTSAALWAEEHPVGQSGQWQISTTTNASGKHLYSSMTLSDKADRTVRFSNDSKNQRVILDVSGDWTALDGYLKSSGKKQVNVFTSEDGVIADDVNPRVATVFEDESGQAFLRIIESYKDEPSGLMDLLRNGTKLHVKLPKGAPWVFSLNGSHAAWNQVEKSDPKQTSTPAAAAPATKPTRKNKVTD